MTVERFWILFRLELLLENWSVFTIINQRARAALKWSIPEQDTFNRPLPLETRPVPHPTHS